LVMAQGNNAIINLLFAHVLIILFLQKRNCIIGVAKSNNGKL
jgi:hypothetical protein